MAVMVADMTLIKQFGKLLMLAVKKDAADVNQLCVLQRCRQTL